MNHTYMRGPLATARDRRNSRTLKTLTTINNILLAVVVLAFLLGAIYTDS